MDPIFLGALGATVVALVAVLVTGHRGARGAHYACVLLFFGALAWAIRQAEIEGRDLVFDGISGTLKSVHFVAVALTFLLVPLVLWSGVALARKEQPELRARHKKFAAVFVVLVLVAFGLGLAMTLTATPVAG